jgi:geranylgeranyl pyrophosphate synthase
MSAHIIRTEYAKDPANWYEVAREELQEVEHYLADVIGSDIPTVYDLSRHLLSAGGKRLRPALVILASRASSGETSTSRLAMIGAIVELIHMASLVHDDVIDSSYSRRGRTTANASWGNKISVLSGDCMLAKVFHLLVQDGDQQIQRVLSNITIRMSESEVLQALCERDVGGWRKNYWQIIRHKTAGFFSACCKCGAILTGTSPAIEEALGQYGMDLGMAFQLTDDILDIAGEPDITGKPVGNDLREGKVTLPALLAIDSMDKIEQEKALSLIENPESSAEEIQALCKTISSMEAMNIAREHARNFAERADVILNKLAPSSARDALSSLASQVIYRVS